MTDEKPAQPDEEDEQPTGEAEGDDAWAGPAEDLETDPAYSPEDPGLKAEKGG